jgi:hypothetical protein
LGAGDGAIDTSGDGRGFFDMVIAEEDVADVAGSVETRVGERREEVEGRRDEEVESLPFPSTSPILRLLDLIDCREPCLGGGSISTAGETQPGSMYCPCALYPSLPSN